MSGKSDPFRLGVDLDGTLADLSLSYRQIERELFGDSGSSSTDDETAEHGSSEARNPKADLKAERAASARRDTVWQTIRNTPNFWTTLAPVEEGTVARLHDVSRAKGWEVYFLTQRPPTIGETVQRQSQRWLAAQGFEMPAVIALPGSRGRVVAILELHALIDDLPKNCLDALSDSKARPLLVQRRPNPVAEAAAKRMRIGVVRSVSDALLLLTADPETEPGNLIHRVWRRLGLV